jgi:hypothetical protein
VRLMLWLWKRLRQWINNVVVCVNIANLHITSTNDFTDEMVTP